MIKACIIYHVIRNTKETHVYMESFKLNSSFSSMIRLRKWDINVNCEFIIALSRMNFGKRIFKSVLSVHLKLHLFGMSSLWLIAKQQGPDSPLKSIKIINIEIINNK